MTIKDIELRFVARGVPASEFGEGVVKMVRVLQWRRLREHREDASHGTRGGIWDEWEEWFDVPFYPDA